MPENSDHESKTVKCQAENKIFFRAPLYTIRLGEATKSVRRRYKVRVGKQLLKKTKQIWLQKNGKNKK